MRGPLVLVFLLAAAAGATAAPAGDAALPPTNMQLLGRAAKSAVEEALESAPLEGRPAVRIQAAEVNRGNWFVEEFFVEALRSRGLSVISGSEPAAAPSAPDTAAASSSAAGQDPAVGDTAQTVELGQPTEVSGSNAGSFEGSFPLAASQQAASVPTLEYRIVDISMMYSGGGRKLLVGSRNIDRVMEASVHARLLGGGTREILWVGSGDARESDRIPGSALRDVEASGYPCEPPSLDAGGFGRLVEPAVVTAIVAGLVYLFYTNQN
jgi:hypothetical protein